MKKRIEMLATVEVTERHFPSHWQKLPYVARGIQIVDFIVDPSLCQDPLARWLARRITSTHIEHRGSTCEIVLPGAAISLVRDLLVELNEGNWSLTGSPDEVELFYASAMDCVRRSQWRLDNFGFQQFGPHSFMFEWPAYGVGETADAHTIEEYFDMCAQRIYATRGVIIAAGPRLERPPAALLKTMADGIGNFILEKYWESCGNPKSLKWNTTPRAKAATTAHGTTAPAAR